MSHRTCFRLVPKPWHDNATTARALLNIAGSSERGKCIWGSFTSWFFATSGQFLTGESDGQNQCYWWGRVRKGWEKEKAERRVMLKKTNPWLASEHISQHALGFSWRYSPGPVTGKAVNFQLLDHSLLQSHSPSAEEQDEEGLLTDPTEKRFVPHLSAPLQHFCREHCLSTSSGNPQHGC